MAEQHLDGGTDPAEQQNPSTALARHTDILPATTKPGTDGDTGAPDGKCPHDTLTKENLMSLLGKALKIGVIAKVAQVAQRELSKPANRQKIQDAVNKYKGKAGGGSHASK